MPEIHIDYVHPKASFSELRRMFHLLPGTLQDRAFRNASFRGAKAIVAQAVATAPVYSPKPPRGLPNKSPKYRYRDNIEAVRALTLIKRLRRAKGRTTRVVSYAWAKSYQANLVEWGSVNNPAYHTMERAAETAGPRVVAAYESEIRRVMRRVNKELKTGRISKRTARALGSL